MTWRSFPDRTKPGRPLSESLAVVTKRLGVAAPHELSTVFSAWEGCVGAQIAARARPQRLVDGVLHVEVSDQRWVTQLRWLGPRVTKQLNEVLGVNVVDRLEIHQDGLWRNRPSSD